MMRVCSLFGRFACLALLLSACSGPEAPAAKDAATAKDSLGLPGDGTATDSSGSADLLPDVPFNPYTGKCIGGPTTCDDGNPCTTDDCDPLNGCSNVVKPCADADPCTLDACDVKTGTCGHVADPCEDDNPCTLGACLPDEGCTFSIVDCSDGDACTSDGCSKQGGGCQNTALDCNDGQTCSIDSCDPVQGCVHEKPVGAKCCESPGDCDDGNVCTVHTCSGGVCSGQGVFGCCKDDKACDDKDPCTTDSCNLGNGKCVNALVAGPGCCMADADCDDKTACTLDKCVGNGCSHEVTCCSEAGDCGAADLCATPTCTTAGCAIVPEKGVGCCDPDIEQSGFEDGDTWQPELAPALNGQWSVGNVPGKVKTGVMALQYKEKTTATIPGGGTVATARMPEVVLPAGRTATLTFQYRGIPKNNAKVRLKAITSAGVWILWEGGSVSSFQKVTVNLNGFAARPATRKLRLSFEVAGLQATGEASIDDLALVTTCLAPVCTTNAGCNDNLAATAEVCASGTCVYTAELEYCEQSGPKCDDAKVCTNDSCQNLKCQHVALFNCCTETKDCEDKNVCTNDTCQFNQCGHTKKPADVCCTQTAECDDKNLCTLDACPAVGLGCTHTQTDANCCTTAKDCDDKDDCSIDSCSPGHQCVHLNQCCTSTADCDDGDPLCTTDICDAKGFCSWTPTNAVGCCVMDVFALDFEDGKLPAQVTLQNGPTQVKWQVMSGKQAHGGKTALWYGDPATNNFDDGSQNTGTVSLKLVDLPNGETLEFAFWVWMQTEGGPPYDELTLSVVGTPVELWKKSSVGLQMGQWVQVKINLSAYAGKSVTLKFVFDTVDSAINETQGVFLDDLTLHRSCSAIP